ncbi:MAG: hypothetical protein KF878_31945 [Planctomycetes bacterium]|nr:hypothetical protein [Planctomycetota bacterium]
MWEWRAFAASFPPLDALARAAPERRVDLYVLAPGLGPGLGLKLRDEATLELKLRAEARGEVERWTKPLIHGLPLPPWRTRELARLLAPDAPVPVRPLRGLDDVLRLVRDLRRGEPRPRAVQKEVAAAFVDPGVRLERATLTLDDRRVETLAVEGDDPAAVLAVAARLPRPADARVAAYPAWLAAP